MQGIARPVLGWEVVVVKQDADSTMESSKEVDCCGDVLKQALETHPSCTYVRSTLDLIVAGSHISCDRKMQVQNGRHLRDVVPFGV